MKPVHVAVAVIQDEQGRVLLSRRPEHAHQGGLWEFPGGKVEPGEGLSAALKREITEELGLDISAHSPLIRLTHHYPDKSVLLDVHRVTAFTGAPRGLEGQPLAWVGLDEIDAYPLPAADRPIVNALRLPSRYLITGPDPSDHTAFLHRLTLVLEQGLRLVQLRAPGLSETAYGELAAAALEICSRWRGVKLLLNAEPKLVQALGGDGLHLNSKRLMSLDVRPLPERFWVGASCHSLEELKRAESLGLDYALLSPVCRTQSHPDAHPLGWQRFRQLVEQVALPVYALGGMDAGMIPYAQEQGAQGIAAIGAFWPTS